MLCRVAGNQARSRAAPSGAWAERALTPRRFSAFTCVPIAWHRSRPMVLPLESTGYVRGNRTALNTGRCVDVTDLLLTRQHRRDQNRAIIGSKIFGFVRPIGNERAKVQASGRRILVQVQGWEAVRRVPAPAPDPCIGRIQRVVPGGIGNTPVTAVSDEALDIHLKRSGIRISKAEHLLAASQYNADITHLQQIQQ